MREEIAERVRGIVAVQLDVKLSELRDDASLMADLGADSFGLVELCLAIEEAFDLEIPDAQTEQLRTVVAAVASSACQTRRGCPRATCTVMGLGSRRAMISTQYSVLRAQCRWRSRATRIAVVSVRQTAAYAARVPHSCSTCTTEGS